MNEDLHKEFQQAAFEGADKQLPAELKLIVITIDPDGAYRIMISPEGLNINVAVGVLQRVSLGLMMNMRESTVHQLRGASSKGQS